MRILHLSSARTFGGGERHLVDLANALNVRGHDVYVAVRPESTLVRELKLPMDNVITLELRNAIDGRSAGALARLIRSKQIDVVHAHMARDYPLAAYAARRNPGVKLIVTRHVLFPLSRLHKFTLARVARVIAVSSAVQFQLQGQSLVPPEKITIVRNGIDYSRIEMARRRFNRRVFFQRWDLPEDSLLVGSVGTFTPLKGYEVFLRAAARVRQLVPRAFFVTCGIDSPATEEHQTFLNRLAKELGLADRVQFIGWIDDIDELFCALDVFVSASHSESFGLAIVEAMAAGAVVVATETEGAREIIQDGETGVLVPVGEIEPMAEAITSLLQDQRKRRQMAANALLTVRRQFTLRRMVQETERIYFEALEEVS